jgi:hypothetical protein
MGKFTIRAGAEANVLDSDELALHLRHARDAYLQDLAQGVKGLEIGPFTGTVSAGSVTINDPTPPAAGAGPREGYSWFLQRLSCPNLKTTDMLQVFKNSLTDDKNYVGSLSSGTASTFAPGSKTVRLLGGDTLRFTGASLGATGVITVTGFVIEVPGYHEWKILM